MLSLLLYYHERGDVPGYGIIIILSDSVCFLVSAAMLELFPEAQTFHLGLFRDRHNFTPTEYYSKLPANLNQRVSVVYLLDPVVATGGTACAAVAMLQGKLNTFTITCRCLINVSSLLSCRCRSVNIKHQASLRHSFHARSSRSSEQMPRAGDLCCSCRPRNECRWIDCSWNRRLW
jgi:hypothetical protein